MHTPRAALDIYKNITIKLVSNEIITAPHSYSEAINRADAEIWEQAMKIEIDQHQEIGTWEPVQLPQDCNVIGCRWVFAVKTKPDGQFEKGKARVVAVRATL